MCNIAVHVDRILISKRSIYIIMFQLSSVLIISLSAMERRQALDKVLGQNNLDLLYDEVLCGKISKVQLKIIGGKMDGKVHGGVYTQHEDKPPKYLVLHMLDAWHQAELYTEGFDGIGKLK